MLLGPDYLFSIAALTDLEGCETHPDGARTPNAVAMENAVYSANELNMPLRYIGLGCL